MYSIICSPIDATDLDFSITSHSNYLPTSALLPCIEEWTVESGKFNKEMDTSFTLSGTMHLKRIVIGNFCYGSVRSFGIDGLNELESIVIGEKSVAYVELSLFTNTEQTGNSCRIVNCPKLVSIEIGEWSFSDYKSLEISHLPSLKSIEMGCGCFHRGLSFSLIGLLDGLN
jgi:singapore isolate B (sub-type 7) whole genome shotgun sequence assembly, scaffold_4